MVGSQGVGSRGSKDNSDRGDGRGSKENRVRKQGSRELSLYIDVNDWWVGVYRGPNHWYMCLLPMIVIRWKRFRKREEGRMTNDASDDDFIDWDGL